MESKSFIDSLNELVTDARFRQLTLTQNFEGFFNEFGINESENAHVLSWFLNPHGSHGLQDIFFKEMLTTAWTTVHARQGAQLRETELSAFYARVSPLFIQQTSFMTAFIDREVKAQYRAADMVITDQGSRMLVVVNNRFDQAECERAYRYFSGPEFRAFEHKIFISFDRSVEAAGVKEWMHMGTEWMVELCATLIEGQRGMTSTARTYLMDLYAFLTGTCYGRTQERSAEFSASLVAGYYQTLVNLRDYRCEKHPTRTIVSLRPYEVATLAAGTLSETELQIVSLYWAHRNTFNTFFGIVELEAVAREIVGMTEKRDYRIDRAFVRGGLRLGHTSAQEIQGRIFDVELVQDWNKNLGLRLMVNKEQWERLTIRQREVVMKNLSWNGVALSERTNVWAKHYRQDWKGTELAKEVVALFDRVESLMSNAFTRVA
jgi:hypothetical protein